jgi:hypothetical protein
MSESTMPESTSSPSQGLWIWPQQCGHGRMNYKDTEPYMFVSSKFLRPWVWPSEKWRPRGSSFIPVTREFHSWSILLNSASKVGLQRRGQRSGQWQAGICLAIAGLGTGLDGFGLAYTRGVAGSSSRIMALVNRFFPHWCGPFGKIKDDIELSCKKMFITNFIYFTCHVAVNLSLCLLPSVLNPEISKFMFQQINPKMI